MKLVSIGSCLLHLWFHLSIRLTWAVGIHAMCATPLHSLAGNFYISLDINFEDSQKSCTLQLVIQHCTLAACSCKCCYIHKILDTKHAKLPFKISIWFLQLAHSRSPTMLGILVVLTWGSLWKMWKPSMTSFALAPPPMFRKMAGWPLYNLMMSIVAVASPASFTGRGRHTNLTPEYTLHWDKAVHAWRCMYMYCSY